MKSKNSCFHGTAYKKAMVRFWPLWTAYFAIWLIALPLQGLMTLRMEGSRSDYSYMERFANMTVPDMFQVALPMALIFGVLAAMAVFSHLYNARSANLFGSLPIRREGLFVSHYLAGLSFLIVPNTVIFLLTLAVEAAGGYVVMQGLLFWLGAACGECFFFYSMAVFCAMFTGHILALPAFYGVLNVFAYGVMSILYAVLQSFYYGFAGFSDRLGDAVEWLTPAAALGHKLSTYWAYEPYFSPSGEVVTPETRTLTTQGLGAVGVYVLAGAALTVCAFLLYRARRLESAGDVVSVRPMRPVFKYGVALCVGMVFGVGTTYVLGGGEFTLMAAILIWGAAGCFAAQMLLDKSFRVFKKWKGAAAVSGVFVALFIVVGLDLTGYETRVPSPSNVRAVEVSGLSMMGRDDYGDWIDNLEITDPDQIKLFTDLHQAAVDERDVERDPGGGCLLCRVELNYTLNNGSTLSREYWVQTMPEEVGREGSSAWAIEQVYRSRDLYWRVYGFDVLEEEIAQGGRLDSAELNTYSDERGQYSFVAGYGADARALLDAVEEDFRAGRIGVRSLAGEQEPSYDGWEQYAPDGTGSPAAAPVDTGLYDTPDILIFRVVEPAGGTLARLEIALEPAASSTLDLLERTAAEMDEGLERQALEESLEKLGR